MGQTKYKQQDDLFKINYNNLKDLNTGIVRLNKNEKQHYMSPTRYSLYLYRHKKVKIMEKDMPC